jgi:hypothetical protein
MPEQLDCEERPQQPLFNDERPLAGTHYREYDPDNLKRHLRNDRKLLTTFHTLPSLTEHQKPYFNPR